MKSGKLIRRFVLYPLFAIWVAFTLLTGTPFPTWDLESLNSPVAVKAVRADGLLLEDDRTIRLPLIKRIPADDLLMLAAVAHGVEITDDGKVFGLLWMNRTCGHDSCLWHRRRVNLASLAAILLAENLDESQVPPEVAACISEQDSFYSPAYRPRRYDDGRINLYDLMRMHRIQEDLDYALKRQQQSGGIGS
jgi:hypothetical protein